MSYLFFSLNKELHNQSGVIMDSLWISVYGKQPGCGDTPGTAKSHKLKYVKKIVCHRRLCKPITLFKCKSEVSRTRHVTI